jgi:hypothetical protein
MSKKNRKLEVKVEPTVAPEATAPTAPVVPVATKPVQYYTVTPPKRPLTGTHFGQGNAFMHTKLCELATANGGKVTWDQVVKACTEVNHRSFASYALKRLKVLVPVVEQAAA